MSSNKAGHPSLQCFFGAPLPGPAPPPQQSMSPPAVPLCNRGSTTPRKEARRTKATPCKESARASASFFSVSNFMRGVTSQKVTKQQKQRHCTRAGLALKLLVVRHTAAEYATSSLAVKERWPTLSKIEKVPYQARQHDLFSRYRKAKTAYNEYRKRMCILRPPRVKKVATQGSLFGSGVRRVQKRGTLLGLGFTRLHLHRSGKRVAGRAQLTLAASLAARASKAAAKKAAAEEAAAEKASRDRGTLFAFGFDQRFARGMPSEGDGTEASTQLATEENSDVKFFPLPASKAASARGTLFSFGFATSERDRAQTSTELTKEGTSDLPVRVQLPSSPYRQLAKESDSNLLQEVAKAIASDSGTLSGFGFSANGRVRTQGSTQSEKDAAAAPPHAESRSASVSHLQGSQKDLSQLWLRRAADRLNLKGMARLQFHSAADAD